MGGDAGGSPEPLAQASSLGEVGGGWGGGLRGLQEGGGRARR